MYTPSINALHDLQPTIGCITHPENKGCECCRSALTPEGKKNVRRNTSALLRVKPNGKDTRLEDTKSILIDCGKSFLTSALEWFPQKGFRKIDALVSCD
jgi:phosphoribosyl 1,2-cyclic phosphodiesterase